MNFFSCFQKVIKEMNRLGMVVDLSHVSVQTMKDAINASKAPVRFTMKKMDKYGYDDN